MIENDWNEENRREHTRYDLEDYYLRVYTREADDLLGQVVDISLGGMRLLSDFPLPTKKLFSVWMDISLESGKKEKVALEARSVWSREDDNPGFYLTGFQYVNPSPQALRTIQAVIDELSV